MTWTNLNFSMGQILTSAEMNSFQNNFAAMMAANTGAPAITVAALSDNSVYGSKIASAVASTAGNFSTEITLNARSFMPAVWADTDLVLITPGSTTSGTADQPKLRLETSFLTWTAKYRYLT